MKKITAFLVLLIFSTAASAQPLDIYKKYWFIQSGDTLPYRILLPANYDSSKQYPLVFFLHGRGESGADNERQLINGARLFLADSNRQRYPAIVVFPQCAANSYWSNVVTIADSNRHRSFHFVPDGEPSVSMRLLVSLTDHLLRNYPVKKQQVYVMGLSMGGMGTFELVRRKPELFAAAVPICGGAHPGTASALTRTNWWIFHGDSDRVVPVRHSQIIYDALKKVGARAKLTIYPGVDHNSWDPAFEEPELLKWLFAQRKK